MENHNKFNNFIAVLPSALGAPLTGWLTEWWVGLIFVVTNLLVVITYKFFRQVWVVVGPNVAARFTHWNWLRIAPEKAVAMAEADHKRVRDTLCPEVNTNSPPELPQRE